LLVTFTINWRRQHSRSRQELTVARQLALPPVRILPRRIEHALDVAVQRFHDANASEHRRAAEIGNEYQRLNRGPPFCHRGFFLWKASNVCRRVAQRAKLSAAGEGNRIVEFV
jgi:hypothetical protein